MTEPHDAGDSFVELQCDGLVGPTHHYAGLSHGNLASRANALSVSHPKKAALQGLEKMRLVASLGIPQLVLPPHPRPNFALLRRLGFRGSAQEMLDAAHEADPQLIFACWSASGMWTANLATVSPAPDTADGRLHFTPANLTATLHRQQEAAFGRRMLERIFGQVAEIHAPLPGCVPLGDEGAANHLRFCAGHGAAGTEVFVYGRQDSGATQKSTAINPLPLRERVGGGAEKGKTYPLSDPPPQPSPSREEGVNSSTQKYFPCRQTRAASEAVARMHGVRHAVFVRQSPEAIDAGAFHNDVIAMSNEHLLIYHEKAFLNEAAFLAELRGKFPALHAVRLTEAELPLCVAVASYFFNSQLLSLPGGGMALVAPAEAAEHPQAQAAFDRLVADPQLPLREVHMLNLRESMRNGGGPACLRLRVPLAKARLALLPPGALYSPRLHARLAAWIERRYPDRLTPEDLRDAARAESCLSALAELEEILGMPGFYSALG